MAGDIKNIQDLANISSLDQLKLNAEGQLQKRSGLGTLGHKIKDAFRSLSEEGRTAIIHRHDSIIVTMRDTLNSASRTVRPEDKPTVERLSRAFDRIKAAVGSSNQDALAGLDGALSHLEIQRRAVGHGLQDEPRFHALPEISQRHLVMALDKLSPDATKMQRIKNDFLGLTVGDIARAQVDYKADLMSEFLKPEQLIHVEQDGFFDNFAKDLYRGSLTSINGEPVPRNGSADGYKALFRAAIPAEHQRFMPFISMMVTQAGLDGAIRDLPFHTGLCDQGLSHLMEVGIYKAKSADSRDLFMTIEGNTLTLKAEFVSRLADMMQNWEDGAPIALSIRGSVTMTIDLSAEPEDIEVIMADGAVRTVLIPKFELSNIESGFIPGEESYTREQAAGE